MRFESPWMLLLLFGLPALLWWRQRRMGPGAAIRVTRPMRDRLGDQFQFSGPVNVELPGKEPVEAWQVTA